MTIADTNWFSSIARDYLSGQLKIPFPTSAKMTSIQEHIQYRKNFSSEIRNQVAEILSQQGNNQNLVSKFRQHDCVTTITAHQPIVGLGPNYFITKAISAIKLAQQIEQETGVACVAVYWLGTEDHDIDELGTVHFNQVQYQWNANTGVVGRYNASSLQDIGNSIREAFGSSESIEHYIQIFEKHYSKSNTFGEATRNILLDLFQDFDLLVIDPDEASLKEIALPIWKQELLDTPSYSILQDTEHDFKKVGYQFQASGREINFFLLNGLQRLRPEQENENIHLIDVSSSEVVETIQHSELVNRVQENPSIVSPNVILRPLFQEALFPNVGFIGGAGELSYWLQLSAVFSEFKQQIPPLILRDIVFQYQANDLEQLVTLIPEVNYPDLFQGKEFLERKLLNSLQADGIQELNSLEEKVLVETRKLHAFLSEQYEGEGGMFYHLRRVEEHLEKMKKKVKRKWKQEEIAKFDQLNQHYQALLPGGGLRERKDNCLTGLIQNPDLLSWYLQEFDPLSQQVVFQSL